MSVINPASVASVTAVSSSRSPAPVMAESSSERALATCDGGCEQDVLGRRREHRQSAQEDVAERVGYVRAGVAARGGQPGQFQREERVAVAAGHRRGDDLGGKVGAQPLGEELLDVVRGQAEQGDPVRPGRSGQPGHQATERTLRTGDRPKRDDDHQRVVGASFGHVGQQLQARLIGPVGVFQDHQGGLGGGVSGQPGGDLVVDPDRGGGRGGTLARGGAEQHPDRSVGRYLRQAAQYLHPGPERGSVGCLVGPTPGDGQPGRGGSAGNFLDQRGLAHPGFARDQPDRTVARYSTQCFRQQLQRLLATDESPGRPGSLLRALDHRNLLLWCRTPLPRAIGRGLQRR